MSKDEKKELKKQKKIAKKAKKAKVKRSLNLQITLIFVAIMSLTILACWFINNVFLEAYYLSNKESALVTAYELIETQSVSGDLTSDDFDIELQKYSGTHNVSIVILNSSFDPIIHSTEPEEQLIMNLQANLFGTIQAERVLAETDNYILIQRRDSRMASDYLEMWGKLSDGSFFLLRTAVESVRVSAAIANRFLLYVGLGAILVSAFVIYFSTKRISKPILKLADISEKMSEMDFTAKYIGKDKTEIALLGNSINKMSENLEKAIEDLKTANAELQKDNELKTQIDEMRKEFISNVSHELKTPIALIQGYAEGLKEGVNEAEERDYYCDVIMDESAKMNNMVKKLLTLNQLESGADILQKEEFNLSQLVKNYVQSSEILTSQKEIKVSLNVEDNVCVTADEFKIEEVFMNYFSNAINHCESDTQKEIDVTVQKEENKVRVTVFNTGKNIPDDCIDRLWEKFFKVDKARTRAYGGSGVGLSIVKAIMEAHGGEYGVNNEDKGVSFWFTLNV